VTGTYDPSVKELSKTLRALGRLINEIGKSLSYFANSDITRKREAKTRKKFSSR
jgi:hypothetical protein